MNINSNPHMVEIEGALAAETPDRVFWREVSC